MPTHPSSRSPTMASSATSSRSCPSSTPSSKRQAIRVSGFRGMTMDDIVQGAGLRAEEAAQGESDMAPISKIGIIGAGQMGSGIAHVVALHGYDVALHDIAKERVDAALGIIDKNLARQVASGKISEEERQKALSRITYADALAGL